MVTPNAELLSFFTDLLDNIIDRFLSQEHPSVASGQEFSSRMQHPHA